MRRFQLRALLDFSPPSIVFDARGGEFKTPACDGVADDKELVPFFERSLLKNAMLFKTVQCATSKGPASSNQTQLSANQMRFYFPYDPKVPGNGGVSLVCGPDFSLKTLESFSGSKLDPARMEADLRKISVLAALPSFSPFLMRDGFERAGIQIDPRHFQLSQADMTATRVSLKAKLKPLASLALANASGEVADAQLELLAHKLWDLDDPSFLDQFGRALKLRDGEAATTIRAWIGVSYFQHEFAERQANLRGVAQWVQASEAGKDVQLRDVELDRKWVRDALRGAWTDAASVFKTATAAYDALINKSDSRTFVEYLQRAQRDFTALGSRLSIIDQSVCIFHAAAIYGLASRQALELLQDLAASMRDGIDGKSLAAA
jgi:hypothetical protein